MTDDGAPLAAVGLPAQEALELLFSGMAGGPVCPRGSLFGHCAVCLLIPMSHSPKRLGRSRLCARDGE